MNAAKNMDSVFADCTENELNFDAMFDDDDTIIDVVAGVDEAGNFITGEDFDWKAFNALDEADDPITDMDDEEARAGKDAGVDNTEGKDQEVIGAALESEILDMLEAEDAMVGEKPDFDYPNDEIGSNYEDSKDRKIEIGGEVGDGKEVSGKENSAESHAYDDTKEIDDSIGLNDKQQTSLEAAEDADAKVGGPNPDEDMGTMDHIKDTEAEKLVCPACGTNPCSCGKVKNESATLDELLKLLESDDPITDMDDEDSRDGKDTGVSDTEAKDQELLGASIVGGSKEDPIEDTDDADVRAGKDAGVSDTEGEKVHAVGAALEAADILDLLEACESAESENEDVPDEAEDEGCKKEAAEMSDATEEDGTDDAADTETDEGCKKEAADAPTCGPDENPVVEDASEGPLEDDDEAERAGATDDVAVETESYDIDADILDLLEADDPITDECDTAEREGKVKHDTSNVEGEDQEVIGAALEAQDFLDDIIGEADPDEELLKLVDADDPLVGDQVVQDLDNDAEIKVAKEGTESELTDEVEAQDDADIEAIDAESETEGEADIEMDYDDDELIDAIINGDVEDL